MIPLDHNKMYIILRGEVRLENPEGKLKSTVRDQIWSHPGEAFMKKMKTIKDVKNKVKESELQKGGVSKAANVFKKVKAENLELKSQEKTVKEPL